MALRDFLGFPGRTTTERMFNLGCLVIIIIVVVLTMVGMCGRITH